MHTYTHIYIYILTYIHTYILISPEPVCHLNMCVLSQNPTYIKYIFKYKIHTYIHTRIRTHIHTHIPIYTHTRTLSIASEKQRSSIMNNIVNYRYESLRHNMNTNDLKSDVLSLSNQDYNGSYG